MSLLSKLAVWLAKLVREVNFANAVMRVPEVRVLHSSPATHGKLEERLRQEER